MNNDLVELVAVAVAAAMAQVMADMKRAEKEPEMWNADDIAFHLRMGKRQVLERYAPHPDFPKSTRLKMAGGGRGQPLWEPEEIRKWRKKCKAVN